MEVDRQNGHVGEAVHITFTVTNNQTAIGGKPYVIESSSDPAMDIAIGDVEIFARWSEQQPIEIIPHRLELGPGQSKTINMTWTPDERARGRKVNIYGTFYSSKAYPYSLGVILPVDYQPIK